jgi:hypothetical protein
MSVYSSQSSNFTNKCMGNFAGHKGGFDLKQHSIVAFSTQQEGTVVEFIKLKTECGTTRSVNLEPNI